MNKVERLKLIEENIAMCNKCNILSSTRNSTVSGEGNPYAKIIFVGEAPGKKEDEQGRPFVGKAGQLLTNMLKACNIERNDVFICNVVKCRPPNNRTPTPEECINCQPFLELQIKVVNPKLIVCLGNTATQEILKMPVSISSVRGKWFAYKNPPINCKVICTYHPSYLLRNPAAKKESWQDLQLLIKELHETQKNFTQDEKASAIMV